MKQYTIRKTVEEQPDWQAIPALNIDTYPWYVSGTKQGTKVKLSADNDTLFIKITAQDSYSFAIQTQLNHALIYQDSCFEFFFSPCGNLGGNYINLEVNCCGTLHLAYGPDRHNREFICTEAASLIELKSSINSPVKLEKKSDLSWCIEISLPFVAIEKFTNEKVNRKKWFANFYRCGGRTEPQYAVWNDIKVTEPDYHQPEHFGELVFSD